MTCIAGVADKGKVWIGADSAGVSELDIQVRGDEKVFVNGPFLMGFCGSFRARDLARYAFKPSLQQGDQNDIEYLVTTFIDEFRNVLIDGGMKNEEERLELDGAFLLGYKGELYCIEGDFQVGWCSVNFNAVGCGAPYALGALDATAAQTPARRVRSALEAAQRWSAGVRGPFMVLSI